MYYFMMADGTEECEALVVLDLLRRAGIEAVTVSTTSDKNIISAHNILIGCDKMFSEIEVKEGDKIFIPGGAVGVDNLLEFVPLKELLIEQNKKNEKLYAICAAPSIFAEYGLFNDGEKATCYRTYSSRMKDVEYVDEPVVKASNIVTSQSLGTAFDLAFYMIEEEKGKEVVEEIKYQIMYRG